MRISTTHQYSQLTDRVANLQSRIAQLQTNLSTGKRVHMPSDDPIATTGILTLGSAKGLAEQHRTVAEFARGNYSLAENAIGEIGELLKEGKKLALQGATGTTDQLARDVIATQIRSLQERLVSLGNSKDSGGRYLFSGFEVQTEPFVKDSGPPPTILYQGDTNVNYLQVGPGLRVEGNVIVEQQIRQAYDALQDVHDRLVGGDLSGLSGISIQLVDNASTAINLARGDIGAKMQALETAASSALRRIDEFARLISERGDADITETIIDLQATQVAYEMSLAAFAGISRISLLDFMRG
ncbi:MAG: flagellar hook-associated protein FlgL [Fimbriimonadales bacterium]|nr:flagellar hook-associated protein FlgL [Fimbriimonadales bacterium]